MIRIAPACAIAVSISACGESGATTNGPGHLDCAAHISAMSFGVVEGAIEVEDGFSNEAYIAMMWHVNSWAVPEGIPEKQAFDAVNARAAELRESKRAAEILETARWCVKNRPR